ncbi:TonB-dependent receptor [bacterium]|nr:TonB-dependent receptor [bacterium]
MTVIFLAVILGFTLSFAQTTGKIAGNIMDKETGEPLIGANVMLLQTSSGTAADADGHFYIINIAPGIYDIQVSMIGYAPIKMENVRVSVNSTTHLIFELDKTVLKGETVVVTASAVSLKKDQTSSVRNVSADQIAKLPVENINQVVNMQAGIVQGHFRGGRSSEVSYLVDGLSVVNSFSEYSRQSVYVEKEVVQDLEVIKGTFDAEYGRAMSGMVNAVTKEGGNEWHGFLSSGYSNYFTTHHPKHKYSISRSNKKVFTGLGTSDYLERNLSQDYKVQLDGPIFKDRLTVFINYRYQNNRGPINGIRRFNPWDYSVYPAIDSTTWHIEHTGDNKYVALQQDYYHNAMGKLTFKITSNFKLNLLYTFNGNKSKRFNNGLGDFQYKYNPDGLPWDFSTIHFGSFDINHMISKSLFYDLKLSYTDRVEQSYLYEDPLDLRYLSPNYRGSLETGFYTGGTVDPGKRKDTFERRDIKFDLYWQASKVHGFKTGFLYTSHVVDRWRVNVRNQFDGLPIEDEMVVDPETGKIDFPFYVPEIVPVTENTINIYKVKPYEMSVYIQDKMEFDDMVIKLGLRYDYFNPDYHYASNWRNPANQQTFYVRDDSGHVVIDENGQEVIDMEMMSVYPKADPQTQLSPRLGVSYKLSDQAVLRLSYGHFFQMPQMFALYENNIFRVPPFNFQTTMGNSQLKAEKTIQYEIGLWQQIMTGMGLEVSLYYKDIYNLLSTKIITTYNQVKYGQFTNKDYGNARGIELTWDYVYLGFSSFVNFTYSFTRGNANNPRDTYDRAGDSMDPITRLIPMEWDQRYTANATVAYTAKSWNAAMTGYINSGTPYTYEPPGYSPLYRINLYENNSPKPTSVSFDLTASYLVSLFGGHSVKFTLNVYNLFDNLNTVWVYGDTGQPYTRIVTESDLSKFRSDYNDYYDQVKNPTMYSYPRSVKLTMGYTF